MKSHDCEKSAPAGFLTSGFRQDGERWTCPDCGAQWVHVCDEAEGCRWDRVAQVRVRIYIRLGGAEIESNHTSYTKNGIPIRSAYYLIAHHPIALSGDPAEWDLSVVDA